MQKYILIGLGNPGQKYAATRHNAGQMFIRWMNKLQVTSYKKQANLKAIETDCFMNNSGEWISSFRRMRSFYACDCLFIAHDDLDIPLGKFKIQFGRGPRDHKGLLSIYQALGTKDFWHVRIGIDNRNGAHRHPERGACLDCHPFVALLLRVNFLAMTSYRESGETYTLKPFNRGEKKILEKTFENIKISLISLIR